MPETPEKPLIRRLWRTFLAPYKGRLALAFAFMIGLAVAEAAFVILTEWIFSGLDPAPGRRFSANAETVMWWAPPIVVGLGILQAAFFYLQSVTSQNVAVRTLRDLQKAMFHRIGVFDLSQSADDGSGQLVSRFTNDMTILRESLTRAPSGVRDIVRLAGLVGILAYQDWVLLLSVAVIYLTLGMPISWLGKKVRTLGRDVQSQIGDMTGLLTETLRSQRMVKTYRLEEYERARLGQAFDIRYSLLDRLIRIRSANEPIITAVGAVAIGAIIGIAALRINAGLLTGAELVSFLVGMAMLSQPARGLGTLNAVVQEGLSSLERVFDVLDREPRITDGATAKDLSLAPGEAVPISFEGVTFGYDADQPVIQDLNLQVPAGATVALVGPSGAGKSSVFNLLPRLYDPQAGQILIAGQSVHEATLASLREAMALVSQDAILFDDTIEANIRFGRQDATDDEVRAAAEAAAAASFIDDLPSGYQTRVGEAGGLLSGGQRQRVALARAFLKDAPILLLDEATAALDAQSERLIEEALARLSKGRTTLVIAHRLSTVRHADLICVMDRGRVVETGTHDELVAQDGLYAQLVRLQFREGAPA
ncbi:ABC transporter ATP-binding protein [Parvularcula sp. LCG005]|uniref:ABC transporter ATP-binding protein n=1 Tax=Parvularcula sp. LCG005 TaxID=3078805 RepID=UPI0029427A72|nr:ABC transporter ATP-binding protein [Parvularcula sp. LCG005]WOI52057.1 ABC transporter ATP-binding protein [Parvularcula sp. LCG005]